MIAPLDEFVKTNCSSLLFAFFVCAHIKHIDFLLLFDIWEFWPAFRNSHMSKKKKVNVWICAHDTFKTDLLWEEQLFLTKLLRGTIILRRRNMCSWRIYFLLCSWHMLKCATNILNMFHELFNMRSFKPPSYVPRTPQYMPQTAQYVQQTDY